MHLPDLIPAIAPVVQVAERDAYAASDKPAQHVINLPILRDFDTRSTGAAGF